MSAVFPLASYFTKSLSLTSTSKTTMYTCGDQAELAFDVTGLSAVASDGTADKVTFIRYQAADATEYVLVFNGPVETDDPSRAGRCDQGAVERCVRLASDAYPHFRPEDDALTQGVISAEGLCIG